MKRLLVKRIATVFLALLLFCSLFSCKRSDISKGPASSEEGRTETTPSNTLSETEGKTESVMDGASPLPSEQTQHLHQYVKTVKVPTCGASGYTLCQCSCGESYREALTPATHEHTFVYNSQTGDYVNRYVCSGCKTFAEDHGKWYSPNHGRTTATYYLKTDGIGDGYFYVGGTGVLPDYRYIPPEDGCYPAWVGYNGFDSLVIGNGITSIGWCAFMAMEDALNTVIVGSSVREIKGMAFYETSF